MSNGEAIIQLSDGTAPTNHYSLTKVFAETIGEMYARGVQPRFPQPDNPSMQPTDNLMSVVITRLGWFIRNAEESVAIAESRAFSAYLSHDDAARYFVRVIESETPVAGQSVIAYAQSRTPIGFSTQHTNAEAERVLGYLPHDVYPNGSPFIGAKPWPEDMPPPVAAPAAKL